MAQNINAHRGSNIDGRTTRHQGYRICQVIRKRIEEANGGIKTVGGMAVQNVLLEIKNRPPKLKHNDLKEGFRQPANSTLAFRL